MAHPGGIDQEPPVLRVLIERVVEPGIDGIGGGRHRREMVGDEDGEHTTKERPGGVEALDVCLDASFGIEALRSGDSLVIGDSFPGDVFAAAPASPSRTGLRVDLFALARFRREPRHTYIGFHPRSIELLG